MRIEIYNCNMKLFTECYIFTNIVITACMYRPTGEFPEPQWRPWEEG